MRSASITISIKNSVHDGFESKLLARFLLIKNKPQIQRIPD